MSEINEAMKKRLEKEDKFITALFYDGDDTRDDFDLTVLGTSDGVDEENPVYLKDKSAYFKFQIGESTDRFLNRFKDDLSDFEEIYILAKIKKDERPKKERETNKE